ncbi:MAG: Cof-type HAD-IIB family hydrolase [Roseburia sp.]
MKKAVFFDIDGTIWDEHMQIPASTVTAVQRLRENGHYAFLCSGRSRANIRSKKLLDIGFDGVVAACGAHIDFHKETIFEELLTREQMLHVLEVLKRHGMPVVLEGPRYIYSDPTEFLEDPFVSYLRKELGANMKEIQRDGSGMEVNKLSANIEQADMKQVASELGEGFEVIVHERGGIAEILPAGHTKATGVWRVCEILEISREQTYAFGDSENDLDMLQFVAHGIAMGNGSKRAKAAAEYVTTTIGEDGILNGLLHYGLIS